MKTVQRMGMYIVILYCLLNFALGGPHERSLLKFLFVEQEHDKLERPAENDTDPVHVDMKLNLIQIIDFNEKKQILTTNAWIFQSWKDYSMTWKPEDYGNITAIRVPSSKIWIPDIVLYNNVEEQLGSPMEFNVMIRHTGDISHIPQRIFKSSCSVNKTSETHDTHTCRLKFGSWSYDSTQINLKLQAEGIDTSLYIPNSEWELRDASAVLNTKVYACCVEAYQDIEFILQIGRYSNGLHETDAATYISSNDTFHDWGDLSENI